MEAIAVPDVQRPSKELERVQLFCSCQKHAPLTCPCGALWYQDRENEAAARSPHTEPDDFPHEFVLITEALDLGLQAWRATESRIRFVDAIAAAGRLRVRMGNLEEQLEATRERLDQAERFIDHMDMPYRYAEWLVEAPTPAKRPQ